MAKKSPPPSPLTFDLPVTLIDKIEAYREKAGAASASAVIRAAVAGFNLDKFESDAVEHRQISVRLDADMKARLVKAAKKKHVSVGELLRVAIDALPDKPAKAKKGR
jgi:Arc/MetJ-type ribon-helix-helix transcriptional regulator